MIEEYIYKGFVKISKDAVIKWLQESIDFTKGLSNKLKMDPVIIEANKIENEILEALTTGVKYNDYSKYINDKIKLCESNRDYFISIGNDKPYWSINIQLYQFLKELLANIKDFEYKTLENGQLTLF